MSYSLKDSGYIEDMKKRRGIARSCVRTHFAEPWQFRVAVDGEDDKQNTMFGRKIAHHNLFDYLAKNVSFGPTEIATEPVEAGANVFTFPKTLQPVVITMTVRDTADRDLYNWFTTWAGKVVNGNGTFNLPSYYTRILTIYSYKDDDGASENALWSGLVYPTKMGDIEMSVDGEGFIEFPITFQQFSSLGRIGEV